MFGFLNVNKPRGPSSHDIVARLKRLFPSKTKLGHAGTLDPFAEGVLVICVGPATRLASYVQAKPKRYDAEITLGATSTTDDVEGEISKVTNAVTLSEDLIRKALTNFIGVIQQAPPAHSAVHVNGERAYKLARKGRKVDLPARPVKVHAIELLKYEYPFLRLDIRCGTGTYIRGLARDIGAALGVGGYCSKLRRRAVGSFKIEDAISPDDINPTRDLLSPLVALESLAKVTVDQADARRLALGQNISAEEALGLAGEVVALTESDELIAIVETRSEDKTLRPKKVFPPRR